MTNPRLSVIISTHQCSLLLSRAIDSVKSQNIEGLQVNVVSDVEDPATYAVARSLLSDTDSFVKRGGTPDQAGSRSLSIRISQAEYIIFPDDDSHAPGFPQAPMSQIRHGVNEALYCDGYVVQEGRHPGKVDVTGISHFMLGEVSHDMLSVRNQIPNNCLVFQRNLLLEHDFDESLILREDWSHLLNVPSVAPLRYAPVHGPIIDQNDLSLEEGRNASNPDRLVETTLQIYRKWPAPSARAKAARQRYFRSAGIPLPEALF